MALAFFFYWYSLKFSLIFAWFLRTGGLADEVTEKILNDVFLPFGDIMDIQIPIDYESEKHRGFAFIEFEAAEDAAAAIDNMVKIIVHLILHHDFLCWKCSLIFRLQNESELFGRTIRVNLAKPQKVREGSTRAVWADDDWLQKHAGKSVDELRAEAVINSFDS